MKFLPLMMFFGPDDGSQAPGGGGSSQSSDAATAPGGDSAAPASADANMPASQPSGGAEPAAKPEPSLLDATTAAVQADPGAASAPAIPAASAPAVAEPNPNEPPKVLTAEEQAAADKLLPFHDHPRFKQVIAERRSFEAKVAELTPAAETMTSLRSFLADNDIPAEEFDNAMEILALLRSDPLSAREKLSEIWTSLEKFSGGVLPEDLQKRVDLGELDKDDAAEIARLRHQQAHQTKQGQRQAQKTEQQLAEDRKQELMRVVYQAGATWEQQKQTSDPDYAKIAPRVMRTARALMQERGNPKDAKTSIAILEDAYKIVKDEIAEFAPVRQPITPVRSGGSIPSAKKEPTTMAEAIAQAAEQT
jgi:hypothetical protein